MAKSQKLTVRQISAARDAIDHAEADAQCGGEWDKERSDTLELGCKVLTQLLNDAIRRAEGSKK